MTWRRLSITADFADFGASNACSPTTGRVQRLTVKSPAWRTQKGLRVGAKSDRIAELHPTATLQRGGWWLYQAYSGIGDGGSFGLVVAGVQGGRVRSLTMNVGAAGD